MRGRTRQRAAPLFEFRGALRAGAGWFLRAARRRPFHPFFTSGTAVRLSSIKLAGFKSFVDPTHFQVPGQLVGVVGPNGCGKSNIIDAVRWVLGESRSSELRG